MTAARSPQLFLFAFLSLVLGFGFADLVRAAKPIPPPIHAMTDGKNRVAAVEILEKIDPESVRVRNVANLSGEAPEELTIRIGEAYGEVEVGKTYLVGFTSLRKNRLLRDVWEEDPDGPKALKLPLVRETVLPDTEGLRGLVTTYRSEDRPEAKAALGEVLNLLEAKTAVSRRLAAYELFARGDLLKAFDGKASKRVDAVLRGAALGPETRDFLLRAVVNLDPGTRKKWVAAAARRVLEDADPQVDLVSPQPSLLQTATRVLGEAGSRKDARRLERFLTSNNPGVAKSAFAAMEELDPKRARRAATAATQGGEIHSETRRVLEGFLSKI